jgi:transposase InsO family protein
LRTVCGLFGYTRQAYYKQLKSASRHLLEEEVLLDMIKNYRKQMPRIGGTKLHYLINQSGYGIGRKALYDLLRNNKLLVRRRKKHAVTTDSRHWMRKWPNLIRGFDFYKPNLLWVSDITYININGGFAYLSLITDAYSRKITGYNLSPTLESEGNISALCMAIENTPENNRIGLIHHSDRGAQYCCKEYIKILKNNNIRISMTENGDPYENALAERVNGILKSEWLDHEQFDNFEQANNRICQIINTYNTVRPHLSCDMLTPEQAQAKTGKLKKRWKKRK